MSPGNLCSAHVHADDAHAAARADALRFLGGAPEEFLDEAEQALLAEGLPLTGKVLCNVSAYKGLLIFFADFLLKLRMQMQLPRFHCH